MTNSEQLCDLLGLKELDGRLKEALRRGEILADCGPAVACAVLLTNKVGFSLDYGKPARPQVSGLAQLALPSHINDLLVGAGIRTVEDIVGYGDLTEIDGIGEVHASQIADAIKAL